MPVITFFLMLGTCFSIIGSEYFSQVQREEAQEFIRTCFKELEVAQQSKQRKLWREIKRTDDIIEQVLSARQIDYKKFNAYESQQDVYEKQHDDAGEYEASLKRPKEKILIWNENREVDAQLLHAYMYLSDEWQQYKKDPLNLQVYERLHKRMLVIAHMLVGQNGERSLVSGTHARPTESDVDVNYDIDRVFFLALYLLNKDLQEQAGAASSSQ